MGVPPAGPGCGGFIGAFIMGGGFTLLLVYQPWTLLAMLVLLGIAGAAEYWRSVRNQRSDFDYFEEKEEGR